LGFSQASRQLRRSSEGAGASAATFGVVRRGGAFDRADLADAQEGAEINPVGTLIEVALEGFSGKHKFIDAFSRQGFLPVYRVEGEALNLFNIVRCHRAERPIASLFRI
jgi:hypothetical protein